MNDSAPRPDLPPDPRSFEVPAPGAVPPPAPQSPPAAAPPAPPQPPQRRRWPWFVAIGLVVALIAAVAGTYLYGRWAWNRIERVEVASLEATTGSGTNYLIVGTDSREGIDEDNPNAGVIFGEGDSGERTDTVVLLHVGAGGDVMMAVPRDLLVTLPDGSEQRINAAIQQGPDALVQTVRGNLGVPVHHYLQVDFAGFLGVVDAVGGVEIEFPYPAFDEKSGLAVDTAGVHELDADQALAYVRSRAYTEIIDGQEVTDPTADLGRVERQQNFLRALFDDMGATRNPFALNRMLHAVTDHVAVDAAMSFGDAFSLARKLSGLSPESVVLPTTPTRTSGGASVLLLEEASAAPVLDRFD